MIKFYKILFIYTHLFYIYAHKKIEIKYLDLQKTCKGSQEIFHIAHTCFS